MESGCSAGPVLKGGESTTKYKREVHLGISTSSTNLQGLAYNIRATTTGPVLLQGGRINDAAADDGADYRGFGVLRGGDFREVVRKNDEVGELPWF